MENGEQAILQAGLIASQDGAAYASQAQQQQQQFQQPSPSGPSAAGELGDVARQPRLLCEECHDAGEEQLALERRGQDGAIVLRWRQKEKLKTTAVAIVLCLNIGVDPPDVIKISPCARLECWVDPLSMQPAKALETIGKNLQAQYERWQPKAKYRMHLDPTVDDIKKLATGSRRGAKNERVLFHYNGHGVPKPTANGEIWVFNNRYTQYIPLSVYELQSWLGTPCIYVLDCSAAGVVINSFRAFMDQRAADLRGSAALAAGGLQGGPYPGTAAAAAAAAAADPMREIIVLAACGANEVLPQNPELPADVFTSCLTTPIKVSLRWFASRSLLRHDGITKELIDRIPGKQTDRKTPLGELNWIFTAITDTIAWNVLPRPLFQKLFRSDLLVASLFRNFLLAERIMAAANCTPVSYPRLPPTHQHPMWQAWDMAAEMCLMQLPTLLSDPERAQFQPSPFFSEQLTAFELWLSAGGRDKKPPEQLPIVLQVLLSQVHRLRALQLLGRFLDMGPWAVDLALSVGIFPYVLKLLQTQSQDLRATLVFIWAKILALDTSCQVDLVKDGGHLYFITYLNAGEGGIELSSRAQAAFVLAAICDHHPKGQALCMSSNLLGHLLNWLRKLFPPQVPFPTPGHGLLLKWLCLCLGKLCQDNPEISLTAIREGAADLLVQLLTVASPEIRAAAVFGLGCLVHSGSGPTLDAPQGLRPSQSGGLDGSIAGSGPSIGVAAPPSEDRLPAEQLIANAVRQVVYDPSVLVRCELSVLYARFVRGHAPFVQEAVAIQQRKLQEFARNLAAQQAAAAQQQQQQQQSGVLAERMPSLATTSRGSVDMPATPAGVSTPLTGESEAAWLQRAATMPGSTASRGSTGAASSGGGPSGAESSSLDTPVGAGSSEGQDRPGSCPPAPAPPRSPVPSPAHTTYSALLESIQMLALDPSPKVARLGKDVLRIAHCELSFLNTGTGVPGSSAPSPPPVSPQHSGASTALGAFTQKLRPYGWGRAGGSSGTTGPGTAAQPGPSGLQGAGVPSALGGTTAGGAGVVPTVANTPSSSSPPSPNKEQGLSFSRHPYVLRSMADHSEGEDGSHPSHLPGGPRRSAPVNVHQQGPGYGQQQQQQPYPGGGMMDGAWDAAAAPLPASIIYKMSANAFSRPQLEPMASAWLEGDSGAASGPASGPVGAAGAGSGGLGSVAAVAPWAVAVDPQRRAFRVREIEQGVLRCRALTVPKLREQVYSVDVGGDGVCALAFHPYHPLICAADTRGFIKVANFNDSSTANAFHVTNGVSPHDTRAHYLPSTVTFLQQINESDGPMLLAGSADGAVRVWRSYMLPGSQRMATALQAVTIHLPPQMGRTTAFAWSGQRSHLFAAGGSHPEMIYCWDLQYEMCSNMIPMNPNSTTSSSPSPGSSPLAVDRIVLGTADPLLLLAACADATLRLFDLRASRTSALVLAPFRQPSAGVAFEPAGRPGIIVAASEKGEVKLMDIRMAATALASAASAGAPIPGLAELSATATYKTVAAHSKGGLSALVAHTHAPLMATGTTNQVVKVWTEACEVVGAIRAQSAAPTHKVAPVRCMAWHPYQPLLAAGGGDSVLTVYCIDQNPSAAAAAAVAGGAAPGRHHAHHLSAGAMSLGTGGLGPNLSFG